MNEFESPRVSGKPLADGMIKKDLFTPDNIHLSPAGYAVSAERLKPNLKALIP